MHENVGVPLRSLTLRGAASVMITTSVTTALVLYALGLAYIAIANASPIGKRKWMKRASAFDIQGHRGGRGHTIENTLPSFAW